MEYFILNNDVKEEELLNEGFRSNGKDYEKTYILYGDISMLLKVQTTNDEKVLKEEIIDEIRNKKIELTNTGIDIKHAYESYLSIMDDLEEKNIVKKVHKERGM